MAAQTPTVSGVTSAASFSPQQIASQGYAAVFGTGLADGIYTAPTTNYGTKLGPTEIFFCPSSALSSFPAGGNGLPPCGQARIVYASPGQVNIVLPVAGSTFGTNNYVVARVNGVLDAGMSSGKPLAVSVSTVAPSIFLAGSDCLTNVATPKGCGLQSFQSLTPLPGQAERGVITDINGGIVWSGNRARLGQYYTAWITGLGAATSAVSMIFDDVPADGYPNPSFGTLHVTYSGAVPQYPGLYQVNFQIPLDIGEGPDGYGAWPCGNYNWELTLLIGSSNPVQIPLTIKNGDVPCRP